MEEIAALQAEFSRLQRSLPNASLSDRVCIEILLKLISKGKVNLVFSTDGKQYLTLPQVVRELQDEITAKGGRVNLIDTAQVLGLDLIYIEDAAKTLMAEDSEISKVGGDLIAKYFLDRVCVEINDTLSERGELNITELSRRFNLSVDILEDSINRSIGTVIKGVYETPLLYTEAYVRRQNAKLRGLLSGIVFPTPVQELMEAAATEGLPEKMFSNMMDKMLKEKRVNGAIQKHTFVPNLYVKARETSLRAFFQANNFIEYESIRKLGILDVKNYTKRLDSEGLELNSCFLGSSIVHQVNDAIEEALASSSWVDISTMLPSSLTKNDILEVIKNCPSTELVSAEPKCMISTSGTTVVAAMMVATVLEKFRQLYREEATKQWMAKKTVGERPAPKDAPEESASDGPRKRPARKHAKADADSEDDDWDDSKKPKKGKKGAKSKKKVQQNQQPSHKQSNTSGASRESHAFDEKEVKRLIKQWVEDPDEEVIDIVYENISSKLPLMMEETRRAIFIEQSKADTEDKVKKTSTVAEISTEVTNLFYNIQYFDQVNQEFDFDQNTKQLLEKHLLKTLCTDIFDLLIKLQCAYHCIEYEGEFEGLDNDRLRQSARKKMIKHLPSHDAVIFEKLLELLGGSSVESVINYLLEIAAQIECDNLLKTITKKLEKSINFAHKQLLVEKLNASGVRDPAESYSLAILLLFSRINNKSIHAPGRCMTTILNILSLPAEQKQIFKSYGDLLVEWINSKRSENREKEEELTQILVEKAKEIEHIALSYSKTSSMDNEAKNDK